MVVVVVIVVVVVGNGSIGDPQCFFLGKIAFSNEICMDYVRKSCIKCVICLGELHMYCSKVSFYQGNSVCIIRYGRVASNV